MHDPEILAPAGSMETLAAALRSGADAVYLGGTRFSARSSAQNFDSEELAEAAKLCHRYGAKLCLAVNTVISDSEADELCGYIKYAASVGVDAFIVQDWGCAELIRRCVPNAVLHASTQMSVHTAAGAELLKKLGWARAVPARELDRETLKKICVVGIETEVFVHGALCMSVSGQCYMSAVIGSRSANRGCCGQACRLPFSAVGNRNAAALSLKDLSLIPRVDKLRDIGVDSLKIEGRMKRPEYVAAAVNELKNALAGDEPDMQTLRGIFSRSGFTDGYFSGKLQNMFGVREKDDVTAAQSLIPKIHELYRFERKVAQADFHAVIRSGEPVALTVSTGDISATVYGDIPQTALNRPSDLAQLSKQLTKLGDTVFTAGSITADIGEGLTVPAGELNRLRREAMQRLTELMITENTPEFTITDYRPELPERDIPAPEKLPIRALCRTAEQARAAAGLAEYIIIPANLDIQAIADVCPTDRIIISPPRFITDEDKLKERLLELKSAGFSRLFCHTPDCIAIGQELGFRLHGSFTLNVFNSYSAEYLRNIGLEDCVFSFEATSSQISSARTSLPLGAAVYGRLPLMLTRNCPIKNEVGCTKCTGHLIDRTGRVLPVACSKEYVEVLNSDVLYVPDAQREFGGISFGLAILYDEDAAQTKAALTGEKPDGTITRGLYRRGVH